MTTPNSYRTQPDSEGHFGAYGGRYVAETLMPLILELEAEYNRAKADPAFKAEFDYLLEHYVGRPSPLYYAERLTDAVRAECDDAHGAEIWFKRDELNHTGAHKINNCIGQILLAIRMGKTRIIAETGAGQHGVATATVAARFGLPCVIYMGARDMERQAPNVFRMKLLGAQVIGVESGARTLKDAMNEALRDWVANVDDTFYIIGTAAGPHPYPELVRDFQSVIGTEARAQMLSRTERLPDLLVAAIGGGSNAIGLFHPFLDDTGRRDARRRGGGPRPRQAARRQPRRRRAGHPPRQQDLSAAGRGRPDRRGALDLGRSRLSRHRPRTRLAQGFGPRRIYVSVTDTQALTAFQLLCKTEGIIPALEPAHAIAAVVERAKTMPRDTIILANLCGRGDKDIFTVAEALGVEL